LKYALTLNHKTTAIMNHEENKKNIDSFSNDAVDGNDVKGGGGPFGPPAPGTELTNGTPMPGDEMGQPPAPGAEIDPAMGGDLPQIPFEGPGPMGPPGPMIPPPFPRP
jgi:hypothetical protein